MVSYFSSCGMRFYVYPDMFISPKKFEEQDKVKKVKYIIYSRHDVNCLFYKPLSVGIPI